MLFFSLLLNIIGILVPALATRRVISNWGQPVALPLSLYMVTVTLICVLNIVSVTHFANQLPFHERITLIISSTTTSLWLWVTYEYIKKTFLPIKWVLFILIEPTLMILINYTNDWHGLFHQSSTSHKVFRLFHFTYSLTVLYFSIGWLARHLYQTTLKRLMPVILLVTILSLPTIAFFLYISHLIPMRIGAPLSVFLIILGVSRFKVLDIRPVARDQVIEQLHDAVLTINTTGLIIDANRQASVILELSQSKRNNRKHHVYVPDDIHQLFEFNSPKSQRHEHQLGSLMTEIIYTPITKHYKRIEGGVLMIRDISQHKKAIKEKQLHIKQIEESQQHLQKLNSFKSDFLANISHEFRTPITLSTGTIDDIIFGQYGTLPKKIIPQMLAVKKHNHNLLRLINQLLNLSQLESVETQQDQEIVDWAQYLPSLVELFQEMAQKQSITLKLTMTTKQSLININEDETLAIINNLISNALKYTPSQGYIDISLSNANDQMILTVTDTGTGIKASNLSSIFDKYYSDNAEHSLWSAGCGIGLALVKHIVEKRRGSIRVKSDNHVGSTFTVVLPMCSDNSTNHKSTDSASNQQEKADIDPLLPILNANHKNTTILIIEDNHDMRDYVALHLQKSFRVITAKNAESGFKKALNDVPDLIISDVMMPGMNGDQLCQKIKDTLQISHIPVILLTANATQEQKIKGLKAQADDYLTKPFNTVELLTRVTNLITQRQKLYRYYCQMFSHRPDPTPVISIDKQSTEERFLTTLKKFLLKNLNKVNLQLSEMAENMYVSERQLQRKTKALTGQSPVQLLQQLRIEMAAQLLIESDLSITHIVYQSGFNSSSYFAKIFKKIYHKSPSQYRMENRRHVNNSGMS